MGGVGVGFRGAFHSEALCISATGPIIKAGGCKIWQLTVAEIWLDLLNELAGSGVYALTNAAFYASCLEWQNKHGTGVPGGYSIA